MPQFMGGKQEILQIFNPCSNQVSMANQSIHHESTVFYMRQGCCLFSVTEVFTYVIQDKNYVQVFSAPSV